MRLKPISAALCALALFALIGCILDGRTAGRGSEVENEVYGVLVDESGDPVSGAKVKAQPAAVGIGKMSAARTVASDSDSVTTDSRGRYHFKTLGAGEYDLFGSSKVGDLVVLIPSVAILDTAKPLNVGTDTLRVPGRIRGRVLVGKTGKPAVLCYIPGTSYLAASDDSGRFALSGVPQGRYRVSYSASGFQIASDSGVTVLSDKTTTLPDKHLAYDPALPPPAPTGLKAVYDTLAEVVRLSWEAAPVSDVEGYVIYRDEPSFLDPKPVGGGFTDQTAFTDSSLGAFAMGQTKTVVYRIKSRDQEANLSVSYSAPVYVNAVSRSFATTVLSAMALDTSGGAISIGDSLRLVVQYTNPGRRMAEIRWYLSGDTAALRSRKDSARTGTDTLHWKAGAAGTARFTARIKDEAGTDWSASVTVQVVVDVPSVAAGADTAVSIGDVVKLRGTASDHFGSISSMAWSIGAGATMVAAPKGEISFQATAAPSILTCVFKAVDDDGNVAFDTISVTVIADAPRPSAGKDTVVSIGDQVNLHGSATDRFGRIVKWEWELDGSVSSNDTGKEISFLAPKSARTFFPCVLKVTDDDGQVGRDTVFVTVILDPPRVDAGKDIWMEGVGAISLHGIASDQGQVVSQAWDIGAKGNFVNTATGDTTITVNLKVGDQITCVFKAVDDDGQVAVDTVWIRGGLDWIEQGTINRWSYWAGGWNGNIVSFKGELWSAGYTDSTVQDVSIFHSQNGVQWTRVPTTISRRTGAKLKPMLGKLWLIGGASIPKPGFPTPPDPQDVWVSTDGVSWSKVAGTTPFSSLCDVAEFKGGMVAETGIGSFLQSNDGSNWNSLTGFSTGDNSDCHSLLSDGASLWSFTSNVQSSPTFTGIWKTSDGNQWSHIVNDAPYAKLFYFQPFLLEGRPAVATVDPDEIHAWHSLDGGLNWAKLPGSAPHSNNTTIKVAESQGKLWLFVNPGGDLPVHVFRTR